MELLRRWIQECAAIPADFSSKHPIDAILRQNLAEKNLDYSQAADARTLIRRATAERPVKKGELPSLRYRVVALDGGFDAKRMQQWLREYWRL